MLQVGLFGTFRMLLDGARVHYELGRSGRNIASYLFAFPERAHRREHLADLFWPGLDTDQSRAALNTAIWRLRKAIGCEPANYAAVNIRTIGTEIVLESNTQVEIDTQLFVRGVQQTLMHTDPMMGDTQRETICRSLEKYQGPFLDGEDADWILEERERLHSVFVRAATVLVRHYGRIGSFENGIALVRRVLSFDPYRESAMRYLLVLLALNDQRAEALHAYERWKLSLMRELGVEPMPATIQVVKELRACSSAGEFDNIKNRILTDAQRDQEA